MKIKKLIILMLVLFVLVPFVSAVPPFASQSTEALNGFQIVDVPFDTLKQNQDFEFEFHVYNLTNGVPIIKDISCDFHLHNHTSGSHLFIYTQDNVSTNLDYSVEVDKGNLTQTGEYAYLISCNDSKIGGFREVRFLITPSGEVEEDIGMSLVAIIIYILGMLFFLGFLANLLKEEHPILAMVFLLAILLILLLGAGAILQVSSLNITGQVAVESALKTITSDLYKLTITLVVLSFIYVMLAFLIHSLDWDKKKKEEKY